VTVAELPAMLCHRDRMIWVFAVIPFLHTETTHHHKEKSRLMELKGSQKHKLRRRVE